VQVEYRIDNGAWTALTNVKVGGVVTALAGGRAECRDQLPRNPARSE